MHILLLPLSDSTFDRSSWKVLHLPVNYGSLPSHTVRCLREVGIDARGLIFSKNRVHTSDGMTAIYDVTGPLRRLSIRLKWVYTFLKTLTFTRPTLIHWYSGKSALPLGLDLALVRLLGIPRLVEWQGTDIRIPEVEFADNPYYAQAFDKEYENKSKESRQISVRRQRRFARAGFACAAPVGMLQYIQPEIFPHVYVVPQRLILSDYDPVYPSINRNAPLIVHSPTAPGVKGTKYVLKAIDQLRAKYPFDFQIVHGLSRADALQLVRSADIFLDQFVLGDRGMAALEAMALGKPVVCYIKPSLQALYPESPVVNATPDSLADVLESLLQDAQLRHDIGRRSRAYMEKNYARNTLVSQLTHVYNEVVHRAGTR